jgi:WD40 repeat protein
MSTPILLEFIIIILSLLYILNKKPNSNEKLNKNKENISQKEENNKQKEKKEKEEKLKKIKESEIENENFLKSHLIKSIKDLKTIKKVIFAHNGHVIIFCDEKKVCFVYLPTINSNINPKIISKSIQYDSITDITYSNEKKQIFVSTKNEKKIFYLYFQLKDNKNKLNLSEDFIQTERKFEIDQIAITTKENNFLSTSGTNNDTEIQIYNTISKSLEEKIDTGGIHNIEIKMTPDNKNLLISTFLNEISVINLEKNEKFNNVTLKYENSFKFIRKKSISGIKAKILSFTFTNDENFFLVSTENKTIKILQIFGNISDSKVFKEIKRDFNVKIVSMYVEEFYNGKLTGKIAYSENNNIYICDCEGNNLLTFKDAHDNEIVNLMITKINCEEENEDKNERDYKIINFDENLEKDQKGKIIVISGSKDGRIKFWNI